MRSSFAAGSRAQTGYVPAPENLAARQSFADGRFGIFLHWGLYAMLGQGEWTMTNLDLNYREYEKLAGGFYPAKFDARAWVTAFREAGARYICFTTRHHDGFSMFHTGQSPYNIVDATPFARDVVKELAEEVPPAGTARTLLLLAHRLVARGCPPRPHPARDARPTRRMPTPTSTS